MPRTIVLLYCTFVTVQIQIDYKFKGETVLIVPLRPLTGGRQPNRNPSPTPRPRHRPRPTPPVLPAPSRNRRGKPTTPTARTGGGIRRKRRRKKRKRTTTRTRTTMLQGRALALALPRLVASPLPRRSGLVLSVRPPSLTTTIISVM